MKCLDPSQDWGPTDKKLYNQYKIFLNSRIKTPLPPSQGPPPSLPQSPTRSVESVPQPERPEAKAVPEAAREIEQQTRDTANVYETLTSPASTVIGKPLWTESEGTSQTVQPGTVRGTTGEGVAPVPGAVE
ncbi:unnamed protein product, partial [Ixodes hexagonus]